MYGPGAREPRWRVMRVIELCPQAPESSGDELCEAEFCSVQIYVGTDASKLPVQCVLRRSVKDWQIVRFAEARMDQLDGVRAVFDWCTRMAADIRANPPIVHEHRALGAALRSLVASHKTARDRRTATAVTGDMALGNEPREFVDFDDDETDSQMSDDASAPSRRLRNAMYDETRRRIMHRRGGGGLWPTLLC
jgi:hypothetical protein